MNLDKITIGPKPPFDLHAVIEISQGAHPIKYEIDKDSGALFVDRFLQTAMLYPANYGFIPHTLADDGDPCDILVLTQAPVMPSAVIRCRPIGVLLMEDEAGQDEKILAVPVDKLHPFYRNIQSYQDLPETVCCQIAHFFERYKDLESGKWVKVKGWGDINKAAELIEASINRYAKNK